LKNGTDRAFLLMGLTTGAVQSVASLKPMFAMSDNCREVDSTSVVDNSQET
jgi:hypothetical protein